MVNAPQRCASLIRGSKDYCTSCFCLFSSRAHSLKRSREHLAHCSGKSRANSPPDGSHTTCDVCACTGSSSASEVLPLPHHRNGLRTAIFYTRLYNRALRTGLAIISQRETDYKLPIAKSIRAAEVAVNNCTTMKNWQHELTHQLNKALDQGL